MPWMESLCFVFVCVCVWGGGQILNIFPSNSLGGIVCLNLMTKFMYVGYSVLTT